MPRIRIVMVDTGYLFPETHKFLADLRANMDLNIWTYRTQNDPIRYLQDADEDDPSWRKSVERCCGVNKNEPFDRAMKELAPAAWLRGIRRDQAETRQSRQIVEWSKRNNCYAISPLLPWTGKDIGLYMKSARPAVPPAGGAGVSVDRLQSVELHAPGAGRRGPPRRPVVGAVQNRMRPARGSHDGTDQRPRRRSRHLTSPGGMIAMGVRRLTGRNRLDGRQLGRDNSALRMITGRLLLMLVVLTATLATRQPAAVAGQSGESVLPVERTTWVQRLGSGVTRNFSRIGLMQRVALRVAPARLGLPVGGDVSPPRLEPPDPLRSRLPPPRVY